MTVCEEFSVEIDNIILAQIFDWIVTQKGYCKRTTCKGFSKSMVVNEWNVKIGTNQNNCKNTANGSVAHQLVKEAFNFIICKILKFAKNSNFEIFQNCEQTSVSCFWWSFILNINIIQCIVSEEKSFKEIKIAPYNYNLYNSKILKKFKFQNFSKLQTKSRLMLLMKLYAKYE